MSRKSENEFRGFTDFKQNITTPRKSSTPALHRFTVTVFDAKVLPVALWSSSDRRLMAKSSEALTTQQLTTVQILLGYHPAGYGPPGNVSIAKDIDGHVITTWSCQRSCD